MLTFSVFLLCSLDEDVCTESVVRTPGTGATELFVSEDSRDAAALEPVSIHAETTEVAATAEAVEAAEAAEPAAEPADAKADAEAAKLAEEEEIARNLP